MKILQAHKYLYRRDGASAYLLDLAELLIKNGHQVKLWSAGEDYDFSKREGLVKDLKKFGHMVWSFEAGRKFERVVREFKPDIIHIHNIYHHISPSILSKARRYKVPVVMTVHDYHLINPNYTLYDHGEICERQGLNAVAHRCIQNSYLASLAGVIEWQTHQWLGLYKKNIARYTAPTGFVKKKLIEGGVEEKKIEVVPLFINPKSEIRNPKSDNYILFAGRLVEEKGIYLLLEIAKQLPEIQFKIAGTGVKLEKFKNIDLLGFVEKEKLQKLITGARLVVVPSLWYDLSPLAVLEAMAMGKVVVASRIGGIADLIKDGETGVLINCTTLSDVQHLVLVEQWVDKLRKSYYDEALLKRIGQSAGEYIAREHNPEKHYEKIMEIYKAVSLPADRHSH